MRWRFWLSAAAVGAVVYVATWVADGLRAIVLGG